MMVCETEDLAVTVLLSAGIVGTAGRVSWLLGWKWRPWVAGQPLRIFFGIHTVYGRARNSVGLD